MALYQLFTDVLGFAVAFIGFGSLVLIWCIFVSCLFLDSDYSFYICSRNNERKEAIWHE